MKHITIKITSILFIFLLIIACKKDDDSEVVADFKAENRLSLGASAEDLPSDDAYSKLTVELVYFGLYKPTDLAVFNFRTFLNDRLNKPGGISIIETSIPEVDGSPFTTAELIDIENAKRTIYTNGDTISVYVFFANGVSINDTDTSVTLGTAYLNTSIVVYEKTLQNLVAANPQLDLSMLETTVLEHEFGHILGLVNLLDDDIHTDHMDIGHPKHCVVEDCLMYFESNTRSQIIERFAGRRAIPELDPLCIADLQAKGGL